MSEKEKRSYLLFNSIEIHLADARREFTKLEDGKVKVAATRTRKQLASISEHIKELRRLALSIQKELPVTKRKEPTFAAEADAEEAEADAEEADSDESEEGVPKEKPKEKPKVRKHRKAKPGKKEE